jgi:HSP20 family molecular chaperone IbpA
MNRTLAFDSPLLLGFERTRGLMERAARINGEAYPPYNVEADGEGRIRITLAVAGFTPDQLAVSVEDNQLTIVGTKEAETVGAAERAFLHRGIAARGFVRGFVLADGLEVTGAMLEDGLLTIEAVRPPAVRSVRTVPIRTAQ